MAVFTAFHTLIKTALQRWWWCRGGGRKASGEQTPPTYEVIRIAWQDEHLPHKLCADCSMSQKHSLFLSDPCPHFVTCRLVHKMRLFQSNFTEDIECNFFAGDANIIQRLCLRCVVNPAWFIVDCGGEVQAGRVIKHASPCFLLLVLLSI